MWDSWEIEEPGMLKAGRDRRLAGEILFLNFIEAGNARRPQSWKSLGMSELMLVRRALRSSGDKFSPIKCLMLSGNKSRSSA